MYLAKVAAEVDMPMWARSSDPGRVRRQAQVRRLRQFQLGGPRQLVQAGSLRQRPAGVKQSRRELSRTVLRGIAGAVVCGVVCAAVAAILAVAPGVGRAAASEDPSLSAPAGTLVRVEQTDSRLIYKGTWSTFVISGASGGSYRRANSAGAEVVIPFHGTRLDWIATKGKTLGLAEVTVDGGPKITVDLSRSTVAYQQRVFSTGELSPGLHVVAISWSALNAAGKYISLDAVEVAGALVGRQRWEDRDLRLEYQPAWTQLNSSSYSGGSFQYVNRSGATGRLEFTGVYVSLLAKKSPVYGKMRILLDGVTVAVVDLYSPTTLYKQRVWSSGGLSPGPHSLEVKWTGLRNPAATKTNVNLDAVEVVGELSDPSPVTAGELDQQAAMVHLRKLASDIGVRLAGSPAEGQAAAYAADYFAGLGYQPQVTAVPLPNGRLSHNVVAVKQGTSPLTIVVGGHMDSKPPAPGGNDNASGAAAVLELARCLKDVSLIPTVMFVLFGSEEMIDSNPDHHHYGSRAFVAGLTREEAADLVGMISLDMVGYGNAFHARTMGQGSLLLSDLARSQAGQLGFPISYLRDPSRYGYSDHEPFERAGYPVVWIEWREDPLYHTAGDTYEHCNPSRVRQAGQLVARLLRALTVEDLQALRAAVR